MCGSVSSRHRQKDATLLSVSSYCAHGVSVNTSSFATVSSVTLDPEKAVVLSVCALCVGCVSVIARRLFALWSIAS